jgi:hypothetical protein
MADTERGIHEHPNLGTQFRCIACHSSACGRVDGLRSQGPATSSHQWKLHPVAAPRRRALDDTTRPASGARRKLVSCAAGVGRDGARVPSLASRQGKHRSAHSVMSPPTDGPLTSSCTFPTLYWLRLARRLLRQTPAVHGGTLRAGFGHQHAQGEKKQRGARAFVWVTERRAMWVVQRNCLLSRTDRGNHRAWCGYTFIRQGDRSGS